MEIESAETQMMLATSPIEDGFSKSGAGTTSETSGNMGRDFDFDDED